MSSLTRAAIEAKLAQLLRAQAITDRDQLLIEAIRDVKVMTLDQIQRVWWPNSSNAKAVQNRLSKLVNEHGLLEKFHVAKTDLEARGLVYKQVYQLSPLGRAWLKRMESHTGFPPKMDQVLHDLLVAEIYVRLQLALQQRDQGWRCCWYGEQLSAFYPTQEAAQPVIKPDALMVITDPGEKTIFSFFLEMDASRAAHGRPSSTIARKLHGYQRFAAARTRHDLLKTLPAFPCVLFVVPGELRLKNMAYDLLQHRSSKGSVHYALATHEDVLRAKDFLREPMWAKIAADCNELWINPSERRPLLDND